MASARGSYRVVACTGRECEDREGGVVAALGREASAIGHVKPSRIPALVVGVEHRARRIASHPRGAGFVNGKAWRRRPFADRM